jgi:hypothetical protein
MRKSQSPSARHQSPSKLSIRMKFFSTSSKSSRLRHKVLNQNSNDYVWFFADWYNHSDDSQEFILLVAGKIITLHIIIEHYYYKIDFIYHIIIHQLMKMYQHIVQVWILFQSLYISDVHSLRWCSCFIMGNTLVAKNLINN